MKKISFTIFIVFIQTCVEGFLFNDGCRSVTFLCPPLYITKTANGCICNYGKTFDPSHPEKLSGNQQTSNTGKGNNGGCKNDWLNCKSPCSGASNPSTGCIECVCPATAKPSQSSSKTTTLQTPPAQTQSQPVLMTSPPTSPIVSTTKPQTTKMTSTISQTSTTLSSSNSVSTLSPSKLPSSTTVSTPMPSRSTTITALPTSTNPTKVPSSNSPVTSSATTRQTTGTTTKGTTTKLVLPIHYTTPHSTLSSSPTTPTTTLKKIICPGVFNCTKACYTGYKLDPIGCPLCECAVLPTNLPF